MIRRRPAAAADHAGAHPKDLLHRICEPIRLHVIIHFSVPLLRQTRIRLNDHRNRRQAEAAAQVTLGITQIAEVVESNSATSEECAASSEELSGQADILKELVGRFQYFT